MVPIECSDSLHYPFYLSPVFRGHQTRRRDYGYRISLDVFPLPFERTAESMKSYRTHKTGKITLTSKQYPEFVQFENLNEPMSVKSVYFEDSFGKGVHLKEVTIEMTDDPVTTGIEKWLPWIHTRNIPSRGSPGHAEYYKNFILEKRNFFVGEK